jgi:endonuclease-8
VPEGDSVWHAAKRLREALAGRVLTRSDFRVPRYATTDLTGRQVTESLSRGKHLLTRVEGGVTVHTHLKMDGAWRVRPAGARLSEGHRVRLILANDTWQAVGYQLGVVEVLHTAREDDVVGHLGPDLLAPDWDAAHAEEAVRRLLAEPERPAGEALLDQRNLAGIGNVYQNELLFLRGVYPWRPAGEIRDPAGMVRLAHRLLDANKDRIGHITTGSRQRGEEHWVYGRAGRRCRRCGTLILRAEQRPGPASGPGAGPEARITFWCPHCQPQS